jgi:transposase
MLEMTDLKILFYSQPIDMRKSIDSLSILIIETLKRDPMDGTLFLFRNRHGNKLKALYYETNCFTIWYRRLERGRYVFQKNLQGEMAMTTEHFRWLLASDKYSYREAILPQEIRHYF